MMDRVELYLQLLFEICPLDDDISGDILPSDAEGKSAMNSGSGEWCIAW